MARTENWHPKTLKAIRAERNHLRQTHHPSNYYILQQPWASLDKAAARARHSLEADDGLQELVNERVWDAAMPINPDVGMAHAQRNVHQDVSTREANLSNNLATEVKSRGAASSLQSQARAVVRKQRPWVKFDSRMRPAARKGPSPDESAAEPVDIMETANAAIARHFDERKNQPP